MFGATSNFHYNTYSTKFTKCIFPSVRITHNLPSGRYQVDQRIPKCVNLFSTPTQIHLIPILILHMVPYRSFTFTFTYRIFDRWPWCLTEWREANWLPLPRPHVVQGIPHYNFILFKTYLENNLLSHRIYCIFQASELIITFSDLTGWIWDNMPWQSFYFFWAR